MSMNELESKVNELRELRRMQDELAGEIAAWTARPSRWRRLSCGSGSARPPLPAVSS